MRLKLPKVWVKCGKTATWQIPRLKPRYAGEYYCIFVAKSKPRLASVNLRMDGMRQLAFGPVAIWCMKCSFD